MPKLLDFGTFGLRFRHIKKIIKKKGRKKKFKKRKRRKRPG